MATKGVNERRKEPRFKVAARVELKGKTDFHFTRDISHTGLFLVTDAELTIGSHLKINLAIPGLPTLIDLQAKVVRQQKSPEAGVGVEFAKTTPEVEQLLREALALLQQNPEKT